MRVYLVGGAVRDKLLGRAAKDQDFVVTGSTPDEMLSYGFKQVGLDFPVFLHPETNDEWALARIERKVGVGYHGFETAFDASVSIEDDLRRRDLTINAMAREVNCVESHGVLMTNELHDSQIIDPFNGQADLKEATLRHTSEAFAEDPLRVLRLARFSARFGFLVADETMSLCREIVDGGELDSISYERYWKEIERAVGENYAYRFFDVLFQCGAIRRTAFFQLWLGHNVKFSRIDHIMASIDDDDFGNPHALLSVMTARSEFAHTDQLKMSGYIRSRAAALQSISIALKDGITPESIYQALRICGVWKDPEWRRMRDELAIYERIGEIPQNTTDIILDLGKEIRGLNAANLFPGEEGPQVGKKLEAARISACGEFLNLKVGK